MIRLQAADELFQSFGIRRGSARFAHFLNGEFEHIIQVVLNPGELVLCSDPAPVGEKKSFLRELRFEDSTGIPHAPTINLHPSDAHLVHDSGKRDDVILHDRELSRFPQLFFLT